MLFRSVSSEIDNLQQVPLNYLQDWLECHRKGEEFYVENVQELPDNGADCLRGILESQGIKSLITIPMLSNGNLIGFVGFDSVKKYHAYSDREKKLLEVFSQAILIYAEENGSILNLETTLRAKSGDIKHVLISAENIFIQEIS